MLGSGKIKISIAIYQQFQEELSLSLRLVSPCHNVVDRPIALVSVSLNSICMCLHLF